MMTNSAEAVKEWLQSSYSVQAPSEWLAACVEWIQQENGGQQMPVAQLRAMVFEQWLLSDLKELGASCLAEDLPTQLSTLVNGPVALQVESLLDVGVPLYGQLQKVKGTANGNTDVSADAPQQPAWEPKSSRMMLLTMTDGLTQVQGMEYRPIPAITANLKPGFKVVVHGQVRCRRGVMLLSGDNVTVLGGEVDSLLEANTPVAVLERAMEINAADNGKNAKQELSGRFFNQQCFKQSQSSKYKDGTHGGSECKGKTFTSTSQSAASTKTSNATRHSFGSGGSVKKQLSNPLDTMDDEWEEDLDYGGILTSLEEPMEEAVVVQPMEEAVVVQPMKEAVVVQPMEDTVVIQPVKEAVVVQPMKEAVVKQPRKEAVVIQPIKEAVVIQPVKEAVVIQPVKEAVVLQPVKEAVVIQPMKEAIVIQPSTSNRGRQLSVKKQGLPSVKVEPSSGSVKTTATKTSAQTLQQNDILGMEEENMWGDDDDFEFEESEAHLFSPVIPVQDDFRVGRHNGDTTKTLSKSESSCSVVCYENDKDVMKNCYTKSDSQEWSALKINTHKPDSQEWDSAALPVSWENTFSKVKTEPIPEISVFASKKKPAPKLSLFSKNPSTKNSLSLTLSQNSSNTSVQQTKPPPAKQRKLTSMISTAKREAEPAWSSHKTVSDTTIDLTQGGAPSPTVRRSSAVLSQKQQSYGGSQEGTEDTGLIMTCRLVEEEQNVGGLACEEDEEWPGSRSAFLPTANVPRAVIAPFTEQGQLVPSPSDYQLLKDVQSKIQSVFQSSSIFTLKGYITTLTDRLRSGKGDFWSLSCRITDGTATIEVAIDDRVLSHLIGFSAKESITLRQQARKDPKVKGRLTDGLQKCQKALIEFSGLIDVRSKTAYAQPAIVNMVQLEKKKR